MLTLISAVEWWAAKQPDTAALRLSGETLTWEELAAWMHRIAAHLIAQGLQPGERVGVCAANSLEYCALAFGIIRAGGIVAPLNTRYTAHEIGELLQDQTPRLIFTDSERRVLCLGHGVVKDEDVRAMSDILGLREGPDVRVSRDLDPDQVVVIIATSGSTAKPKGVMFSHRTMLAYASGFALEEPDIRAGSRVILVAPLATSAGFVQLIHYSILGCTLYLEPVFEAERFLRILVDERINNFAAVPLFFERIAACPGFTEADFSQLHVALTGGSRVSQALQETWVQKGVIIRQIYGQTECGGNATMMPKALAQTFPEKCGRGGIFTELRIVNADGDVQPPGSPGQILIRGPATMVGYWNNPEATAATLKEGWLYTGDIGVLDEQGYLTFVDRMKDILISGGLNISAAEVERAVATFPGVVEVAVIAAKDDRFGETPLAVVHSSQKIDVPALIEHCNRHLADFKVPRYVVIEPEPLPRLATQKIAKTVLRERYKDAHRILPRVR